MICESCRAGDPECNAWIACDRQMTQVDASRQDDATHGQEAMSTCTLVYEVGYDEDDPYTEPRRVLVCWEHP